MGILWGTPEILLENIIWKAESIKTVLGFVTNSLDQFRELRTEVKDINGVINDEYIYYFILTGVESLTSITREEIYLALIRLKT